VVYFDCINKNFQAMQNIRPDLKSFYSAYHAIFESVCTFRPPLFFVTATPFLLFGINKNNVIMSNLIYFAILLFATYGIGKKLYGYKAGILSAFLVSMFPAVFALSRVLILDFALAAMVALTFYLFTLNKFSSLSFSLLTGIVVGLGSLTKQSYFVFLFLILLYFFSQADLKNKKIIRNFIVLIILGSLIAATYYVRLSSVDLLQLRNNMFYEKNNTSAWFYLQGILNRQLFPVFFMLLLTSLFFCFKGKKYLLPLMILIPLIIFSTSANKQDRFMLPLFPYFAVIISGFMFSLSKYRKLSVTILVLFSLMQYFIISYGNILPINRGFLQKFLLVPHNENVNETGLFSVVDEGDWLGPAEETLKIINGSFTNSPVNREIKILFIVQDGKIINSIYYLKTIKRLPFAFYELETNPAMVIPVEKIRKDFNSQVIQSDFIVIEKIPPDQLWSLTEYLCDSFKRNMDKFALLKGVSFPRVALEGKDKFCLADSLNEELPERTNLYIFKNKSLKN